MNKRIQKKKAKRTINAQMQTQREAWWRGAVAMSVRVASRGTVVYTPTGGGWYDVRLIPPTEAT
jgi:hypothetical protein